jgi:hypothetical protein
MRQQARRPGAELLSAGRRVLRSVLKRPHRALLALGLEGVLGESGSQSRCFYRVRQGWGCADGRETRTIRHCRAFVAVLHYSTTPLGEPTRRVGRSWPQIASACLAADETHYLVVSRAVSRTESRTESTTSSTTALGPAQVLLSALLCQLRAPPTGHPLGESNPGPMPVACLVVLAQPN